MLRSSSLAMALHGLSACGIASSVPHVGAVPSTRAFKEVNASLTISEQAAEPPMGS